MQELANQQKTETDIQAELELKRGWIRKLNKSLFDNNLQKIIQDSSNGADLLNMEIKQSEVRLKAVKSGIPL